MKSLFFISSPLMKSENSQCIEDSPLNLIEMVCTNPECRKMQYFDSAGVKPHECKYCYGLQRFVNNNLEGKMLGDRLSEEVTTEKHFELEMLGDAELMINEFVVGRPYDECSRCDGVGKIDNARGRDQRCDVCGGKGFMAEENEQCFNALSTNYLNRIKRFALGVDADEKERDWALKQVSDKSDFKAEKLSIWSQDKELDSNYVSVPNDYALWDVERELPTQCKFRCNLPHEHSIQSFKVELRHDDDFWKSYELARVNAKKKADKLAKPITEDTLKWVGIYCNKFGFVVPEEQLRKMSEHSGGQFTWACNVKSNNKANPTNGFTTFIKPILPKEKETNFSAFWSRQLLSLPCDDFPCVVITDENKQFFKFIEGRMGAKDDLLTPDEILEAKGGMSQ